MNRSLRRALFWIPRILTLVFALFISLFAFDVFGEGYSFWESIFAFLMHLVPTYLVLIALAIAWRWEWVGVVLFAGLGIAYLVIFRGNVDWVVFLLIPGPLFLLAILFAANWLWRAEIRAPQ